MLWGGINFFQLVLFAAHCDFFARLYAISFGLGHRTRECIAFVCHAFIILVELLTSRSLCFFAGTFSA